MKVAFYKAWNGNGTLIDYCISIFTVCKYSHTELVFKNGVSFSASGRDNSTRFKRIDFNSKQWDFIDLYITDEEALLIKEKATELVGKKYDYLGAIFSWFSQFNFYKKCIEYKDELFCSESTVELIKISKQYSFLKEGCKYSPKRLYKVLTK